MIRKATIHDSEKLATLILLAMEDVVFSFLGKKDKTLASVFMKHFTGKENNQYSYQNCWVVEKENEVIAAANIYDGARLKELRKPVIDYIKTQNQNELDIENETQEGEFYIDSLAVSPLHQGKGIGSEMLQFLILKYVNENKKVLGLLVDENNTNAKNIYLKMGFIKTGSKVFLGKKMDHLQIAQYNLF